MATGPGHDPPGPPLNGSPLLPSWIGGVGIGQLQILSLQAAEGEKRLNPFIVGKSMVQLVGDIESTSTEANGTRYVLRVRDAAQVTKLLGMNQLFDGTAVNVSFHPTLNTRRCVISCREIQHDTEADILKWLEQDGVIGVRRITRLENGIRTNTPTLILTINGTCIPEYIRVGPLRIKARLYIPDPMLCYNCYAYGHTKARCKFASRCRNCSQTHQDTNECNAPAFCFHCSESHSPASRSCIKYKFEKEVTQIRFSKNLSHAEAVKQVAAGSGSYAEVTSSVQQRLLYAQNGQNDTDLAKQLEEKDQLNKKLMDTIAILMKRVEDLETKDREKKKSKKEKKRSAKETQAAQHSGTMETMVYETDSETDQVTATDDITANAAATVAAAKEAATTTIAAASSKAMTVATTAKATVTTTAYNYQVSGAKPKQTVQNFKRQLTSSEISLPSKKANENPSVPHPIPTNQFRTQPQNKTSQQQQQLNKR